MKITQAWLRVWVFMRLFRPNVSFPAAGPKHSLVGHGCSFVCLVSPPQPSQYVHILLWAQPLYTCSNYWNWGLVKVSIVELGPVLVNFHVSNYWNVQVQSLNSKGNVKGGGGVDLIMNHNRHDKVAIPYNNTFLLATLVLSPQAVNKWSPKGNKHLLFIKDHR